MIVALPKWMRVNLRSRNRPKSASHGGTMQQDTIAAPPGQTPSDAMLQLIFNFWITRSLYAAAKLGIADVLKSGPAPIDRIAAETGTQARSLYRLLRALASV